MIKKKHFILIVFLLFCLFFIGYASPDKSEENDGITLTWQDLQKLLDLQTDKIKITWKEFQKLLEQAGNQINMNFDIKEGIVTIKRSQFLQILKNMRPFVRKIPIPPKDYLVREARYIGIAGEKNSQFTVLLKIYVFKQEPLSYIHIPILSSNTAISDIIVDGVPGVMQIRENWYNINLKESGYHEIKATFSVSNSKQSLYLPIIRSIINTIDFTVPFKDFEINVNSALNAKIEHILDKSHITVHMPSMSQISINWNRKIKKKEKKPPLFYANTHNLISVDSNIIKVKTQVDLEVLQSSLDNISLLVPGDYEVINIIGSSINNWQVRETDIGRVLEIHFGFNIKNKFQFTVLTERMLGAETLGVDFEGLQVIDARRETGNIGIVAQGAVEVEVQSSQELEKKDFHKLPKRILAMSSRPILYSYKYSKHPYRLDIAIHKHEQLEGISTVIEYANATALFLEEGKMLYKIAYIVRNSHKQFMELELPGNTSIWTVLVDKKREKASRNKKGKVLIPLIRSSGNGDKLKSFKVELIYTRPFKKFRLSGSNEYFFPKTDIFINKMRMEMFLPESYSYKFDKGEWREEKVAGEIKKSEESRLKEEDKAQATEGGISDKSTLSTTMVTGKVPSVREKNSKKRRLQTFSLTGPAGLSSISVYLPLSGVRYIFSKNIIDKYETYPIKFSYFHKQFLSGIYVSLGIILLIFFSFYISKRLKSKSRGKKPNK